MTATTGTKPRVIIIGGSMGGLFAGLYFLKAGWDVHVYERVAEPLNARGAGIATHPELFNALKAADIDPGYDFGVHSPGRSVYGNDGQLLCREPIRQVFTAWGRLHDLLLRAFPRDRYHVNMEYAHSRHAGEGVEVTFADGSQVAGDLLIAADGIYSTVRSQYQPQCAPVYTGYCAWRGLVPESDLSEEFRAEIFEYLAFCLPPHEQCLGYAVAGPDNDLRVGQRRYNVVWYRPANATVELPELLTDIDGNNNGVSIAPNKIRQSVINDMRQAAGDLLAPQFRDAILKVDAPFIQPIYDMTASRLVLDRVAIIGDAAFIARPHVGMGVTKAAEDAWVLARCCAGHSDIASGLKAYEDQRLPVGQRIVDHGRLLGCYIGDPQSFTAEQQQQAATYSQPEAVIRETADGQFLRDDADLPDAWAD